MTEQDKFIEALRTLGFPDEYILNVVIHTIKNCLDEMARYTKTTYRIEGA